MLYHLHKTLWLEKFFLVSKQSNVYTNVYLILHLIVSIFSLESNSYGHHWCPKCGNNIIMWTLCVSLLPSPSSMPHNDLLEGAVVLEEFCKVKIFNPTVCQCLQSHLSTQEMSCVLFAKHSTALLALPPCGLPSPASPST